MASLFAAALDALYGIGHPAYAEVHGSPKDCQNAFVTDLRAWEGDPSQLPSFTTWAAPLWFDPAQHLNKAGFIVSGKQYGGVPPQGCFTRAAKHFSQANPWVVLEIDYLLVPQTQIWEAEFAQRGLSLDYLKSLQRSAVSFALQMSGFPYQVLLDSCGKSIHAICRLSDSPQVLEEHRAAKKPSVKWQSLEEKLFLALGNFDVAVLRRTGAHGLSRTPGAMRYNKGKAVGVQQILDVRPRQVMMQDLEDWAEAQLGPACLDYVYTHPQVDLSSKYEGKNPFFLNTTRKHGWLDIILNQVPQGDNCATTDFKGRQDWQWRANLELAKAGAKKPRCLEPPSPSLPYGRWEAPFLWYVQGYVMHALAEGSFFAHDHRFNAENRTNWPDAETLKEKIEDDKPYREREHWKDFVQNTIYPKLEAEVKKIQKDYVEGKPLPEFISGPEQVSPIEYHAAMASQSGSASGNLKKWMHGASDEKVPIDIFRAAFLEHIKHFHGYPLRVVVSEGKKEWYHFNGKYWKYMDALILRGKVRQAYLRFALGGYGTTGPNHPTKKDVDEVMDSLIGEDIEQVERWDEVKAVTVMENGTLYLNEHGCVFKENTFSANDYQRSCLPYHHDPSVATPYFDIMVDNLFPDPDLKRVFLEFVAVSLFSEHSVKAIMVITGEANAGKTTLVNVVESLFGHMYCSPMTMDDWGKDTFDLQSYEGKRLLYQSEFNADAVRSWSTVTSVIKKLTGGDKLEIKRKFLSSSPSRMNANALICSNDDLRWREGSEGAIFKRIVRVRASAAKKKIPDLQSKIIDHERPGIVHRLILSYMGWAFRNASTPTVAAASFALPDYVLADQEDMKRESDSVGLFLDELLVKDDRYGGLCINPLYTKYKEYAKESGYKQVAKKTFEDRLKKYADVSQTRSDSKKVQGGEIGLLPENREHWPAIIHYITGYRPLFPVVGYSAPPLVNLSIKGKRFGESDPATHGTPADDRVIPFPRYRSDIN
ncbi:MAG: hypothetical protein GF334_01755 [Candidatus Altiarchaeales archaeon]|nr:hypothetical protein [Candidatus Altiarchaeales archaeon]